MCPSDFSEMGQRISGTKILTKKKLAKEKLVKKILYKKKFEKGGESGRGNEIAGGSGDGK